MSKDDRQQQEPSEDGMAQFHCGTTAGDFEMIFYREWSPHGYDRVVQLLERGFYDHSHFFRVIHGFLAQFGIRYNLDTFCFLYILSVVELDTPSHVGT